MLTVDALIGREREQAQLAEALAATREGRGGLLLVAGEAGIGKTRLVQMAVASAGLPSLYGGVGHEGESPFGPIVAALRAARRRLPGVLDECAPPVGYLALLMPELGPAPNGGDRATLIEAFGMAFAAVARHQPTVVVLDDLHWTDSATLELLPPLAAVMEQEPLLIIGVYRNDELSRGHALRRLRTELRRRDSVRELLVEPLDQAETAALAARVIGGRPSDALAAALFRHTQGVPFFVEELSAALVAGGRLQRGRSGVEMAADAGVPVPDTVRDAVLLRADALSEAARRALEIAAVAGPRFDLDLLVTLGGPEDGIDEAITRGFIAEVAPGQAAFRHALMREALYGEIPWTRRRALHRAVAAALEAQGAPPAAIVDHLLAGRDIAQARHALAAVVTTHCRVHAYRDAARAARRALELWPEGEDDPARLDLLGRLAHCAELSGDAAGAARAWREVADGRRLADDLGGVAAAERRLATVCEMQGHWERALAAREVAAQDFASAGLPGEAAAERLAAAAHLQSAGSFRAALALVRGAAHDIEQAGRPDLQARALGIEGIARAKLGQTDAGLTALRAGLDLALDHNLAGPAAEIYQRLAVALEHAADYTGARDVFGTAIAFCDERGQAATAQFCRACLAVVLWATGEWDRAVAEWQATLADGAALPSTRLIAASMTGLIEALRGETKRARALLVDAAASARRELFLPSEFVSGWGLAVVAELDGDDDAATERYHALLARWRQSEDHHYALLWLQWATTFFAIRRAEADVRACAGALADIAAEGGNPEALAVLAHALGEAALLDGDTRQAAYHFGAALDRLDGLGLPFARAQTALRAGIALAAGGEHAAAVRRLVEAERRSRELGVHSLHERAAEALIALGEPLPRRPGRRQAGRMARGGLTARELEIVRLVAAGRSNREIAETLVLSPRTVEMHVGNVLCKLGCHSRTEASHRARQLGLLE